MKHILFLLALLVTTSLSAQILIQEKQLTATVQLNFDNGAHGSGFFFKDSSQLLLVTAKHVLLDQNDSPLDKNLNVRFYSSDISRSKPSELVLDFSQFDLSLVYISEKSDIAMVKVGNLISNNDALSVQFEHGISRKGTEGDIVTLNEQSCLRFDSIRLASSVYIFGYPVSLSMKGKYDSNRPLLRKGAVAGKNYENGLIIVDCQVDQGVSGSPVFVGSDTGLKLIGVVAEIIPFVQKWENQTYGTTKIEIDNSGYSVVEPIDLVLGFLRN